MAVLRPSVRIGLSLAAIAMFRGVLGSADAAETLEPGVPVERDIPQSTKHSYSISLSAGDYLRVLVETLQSNVAATVLAPDGKLILSASGPTGPSFVVAVIASAPGTYRIEIDSRVPAGDSGRYRLTPERPRAATPADHDLVQAYDAYQEANRLLASGPPKPETLRAAVEIYGKVLETFRSSGEREGEAEGLQSLGTIYGALSEYELEDQYLNRASQAWRALGNSLGERMATLAMCRLDWNRGRANSALDRATRLLADARAARDLAMQKTTLAFLAGISSENGDYQQLIGIYKEALALETSVDTVLYARALQNLGFAYCRLNEFRTCLEYRERAAAIYRAQGAVRDLAAILSQMSGTYQLLGEWQAALRVSQEAGGGVSPVILAKTGQYALAVETARQTITRYHERGDSVNEAIVWANLAGIYADGNERDRAVECLEKSLGTYPVGARGLAQFRYGVGKGFLQLGYTEKALELFHQFLNGGDDSQSPNYAGMVEQIAQAERDAGLLEDARAHVETALERWEDQRSRIASPELRASFSGREINDVYIDILMAQQDRALDEGNDAHALAVSDHTRARSLIANLGDTVYRIREGVDPKLLEREKALQREFNRAATLQQQSPGKQAQEAAAEINRLTGELKLLRGEIRLASPRYASLTEPAALSLAEIRQQVLAPDTLLLEYSLGEKRSFLWVVTPDALHSFVLPARAEIESAVRRVYDLLTAPQIVRKGETLAQSRERIARAETAYPAAAADLARMIVEPAAGLLGERRLLIVTDGALAYVPFSALPDPKRGRPLVAAHEIVRLPSASALVALRAEVSARGTRARPNIAVLADPVFASNDERLSAALRRAPQASSNEITRAAGLGASLPRLVFSRREANNIAAAAQAANVFRYLDFQASHALATSSELARYGIVHFATHGILNDETPELSGIVLSMVDQKGKPQDGFLRLHEIYNLHLPADLVVLSACQTALGKEIRGEGIVSLSRAFMYAGAARVIASLWRVDDAGTAELMGRFYHKLLAEHSSPAAALRSAQLEMEQQVRWRFPYHWAAFELQGEWK